MRVSWMTGLSAPYLAQLCFRVSFVTGKAVTMEPADACEEFKPGSFPSSVWTFTECMDVWTQFSSTLPLPLQRYSPVVDTWREAASKLRRAASPCLITTHGKLDGVGSTTIRFLATWVFSREMGCDWVTPDYGRRSVPGSKGTVKYCHGLSTRQEHQTFNQSVTQEMTRCTTVNWIDYFQFRVPTVDKPEITSTHVIELSSHTVESIERVMSELEDLEFTNLPWERVMFTFTLSFASRHFVCGACWDKPRRQIVRTVLQEARQNFHRHPRPWYDESPECAYDKTRLNFAIHVRMGDRRTTEGSSVEYFTLLEQFIETVTAVAVDKGLSPPLFHIFSETVKLCPSAKAGSFDEFPTWPVELDQVEGCLVGDKPEICHKTGTGESCSPTRSGLFNVREYILLHLGPDVRRAMSCMVNADGVLMGCSTFGQIAGLFSQGISFFSTACDANRTPYQYRMIPPFAIAERGHLWVPVLGSWHDPVLASVELFRGTLDIFLAAKNASAQLRVS